MQAKLKIYKTDFDKAKQITTEIGEWESNKEKLVCPKCGSEKYMTIRNLKEKWQLAVSLFFSLITFTSIESVNFWVKLVCLHCEHEF